MWEKWFSKRSGPDGPQEDDAPGETYESFDKSECLLIHPPEYLLIIKKEKNSPILNVCFQTPVIGELTLRVLQRKL